MDKRLITVLMSILICLIYTPEALAQLGFLTKFLDRYHKFEEFNGILSDLGVDRNSPNFRRISLFSLFGRRAPAECPENLQPSYCAPCLVKCEDRLNPPRCSHLCRSGCGCPVGTFLSERRCVPASDCPDTTTSAPKPCSCSNYATCTEFGDRDPICTCNSGYSGDGISCFPIPEEIPLNIPDYPCNCGPYASCSTDANGQRICICINGYTQEDGRCVSEQFEQQASLYATQRFTTTQNTPTEEICDCSYYASCVRIPGRSAFCVCNIGYSGDGRSCEKIHTTPAPCQCSKYATCTLDLSENTICTCNEGYYGDGIECTKIAAATTSQVQSHQCGCHAYGICITNSLGQDTCACQSGYVGDGRILCIKLPAVQSCDCDENAICSHDIIGTPTCHCNEGYSGDGRTCVERASTANVQVQCSPACEGGAECVSLQEQNISVNFCRCPYEYAGSNCASKVSNAEAICYPACEANQRCYFASRGFRCL